MKRTTIVESIAILTLSLFLYATISKIMDYTLFKEQLAESPVMKPFATMTAIGLPFIEFTLVVLLSVPRWRLKGLWASLCLLTIFIVYIVAMMATSDHLPCSCGGLLEQLSWKEHIFFNAGFILLDVIAIRLTIKMKQQSRQDLVTTFG